MGCGSSQVESVAADKRPLERPRESDTSVKNTTNNTNKVNGISADANKRASPTDSNANRQDAVTSNPVPKSIAFTVDLEGKGTGRALLGAPPPRLKRLDPLNVPQLTAAQLAEKQKIADEKREQALKRKQSASTKQSRRRQQILDARKFDQEIQQQEAQGKIEESLTSAGKSREAKLTAIQEKQKIREQRARRAREKVQKLNDLDNELDLEMEKDSDYNAEDVDSWLDGENNNDRNNNNDLISADSSERIYDGRASPKKRFNPEKKGIRRGVSVNTIDSFDNAYNKKPPSGSHRLPTVDGNMDSGRIDREDDFFDT